MAFGGAPRDPEELEAEAAPVEAALSPSMTLGEVQLTVSELERSVAYYQRAVGLELLEQGAGRATMGVAGRPLLGLIEEPGARPAPGHTGLYHFALLLPRRADLARWLLHAARDEVALVGLSDHFVSEALYLSDPDGHGIEIYWDRPRETWEGQVAARMTTAPLDVDDLMGELDEGEGEAYAGLPAGCTMGHIHLKVASIPETVAFYRDVLGLGLMAQLGVQAAFLAAGGYHHHVGANTWESAGGPRRRLGRRPCDWRRSSSPTTASAPPSSSASPKADTAPMTRRRDRSSTIRRATRCCSRPPNPIR